MKILHVISTFSKGGGERIAVELANEAVKDGHEVSFLAGWQDDPAYLQDQLHPGVTVRFISDSKRRSYFKLLIWVLKHRKAIAAYDVLHCHLTYGAVAATIVYLIRKRNKKYKRPLIVETYHAVGMAIPSLNRWIHSRMLLARDGIALMAKDPYWSKFVATHHQDSFKIIPNGISVSQAPGGSELRQNFLEHINASYKCKFIVGTVGVLRPDRKPWLYIPIFKAIKEKFGDEVFFVLAGGGAEAEKVKELIQAEGLTDSVYLPGVVTDSIAMMSNMDVYVSVGVGDTAGISMIEAAMCKVPVIGIQMIEGYVTKEDDWFWSHVNVQEVANKIIALLEDEHLRNDIASKQYDRVNEKFNSKAMFAAYKSFYEQLVLS